MAKKRFRVTNYERIVIKGIAAGSLDELKEKSCRLFQFETSENILLSLPDGTTLDDDEYVLDLPDDTLILILTVDRYNSLLRSVHQNETGKQLVDRLLERANMDEAEFARFLEEKFDLAFVKRALERATRRRHLSTKEEDPDWFKGCCSIASTKEQYLRYCAKGRIRSYLKDFEKRWQEYSKGRGMVNLKPYVDSLKQILKSHNFYGCYFDRSNRNCLDHRYCDEKGTFSCEGMYNENRCNSDHSINPYDSADARLFFATWNLDHSVERHRVIRSFIEASEHFQNNNFETSVQKLTHYLFSRDNLKLVHKSCHVIGTHSETHIDCSVFLL